MSLHNRILNWLTVIFLAVTAFSSALTVEQTVVLEPGGGMKVSYAYEMPTAVSGILAQLSREMTQRIDGMAPHGGMLDETGVRRQFSGIRGVYVESYSKFPLQDRVRVELAVVALDAASALATGAFGPFEYLPAGKGAADGGVLLLPLPSEEERQKMDPEHAGRLAELLGGFEFTLRLTAPSAVADTSTGTPDGPNRRVWKMTLDSLTAQPQPVVRLQW